jgi:hypothetical protein
LALMRSLNAVLISLSLSKSANTVLHESAAHAWGSMVSSSSSPGSVPQLLLGFWLPSAWHQAKRQMQTAALWIPLDAISTRKTAD